jgi:hypothetical protein
MVGRMFKMEVVRRPNRDERWDRLLGFRYLA